MTQMSERTGSEVATTFHPRIRRHLRAGYAGRLAITFVLAAGLGAGCASHSKHVPAKKSTAPAEHLCPLTGQPAPGGSVPDRAALGIKVENAPDSRPPWGIGAADMVYEEPVEGGITRFIVIFQCTGSSRVEPVRSARLVDPDILRQFGHVAFGYAGGIGAVLQKLAGSPLIDVGDRAVPNAYHRDPSRLAPHNYATSTAALWAHVPAGMPAPVLGFDARPPAGPAASTVRIPFSDESNVVWRYDPSGHKYLRFYGDAPAAVGGGGRIEAANVIVQRAVLTPSPFVEDASGVHEWDIHVVGSGQATVYRDGVAVSGTWSRPSLGDTTRFLDAKGSPIRMKRGVTWVELVPTTVTVSASAS